MDDALELEFDGEIWYWRGPSPFHFVTVPDDLAVAIRAVAADVTYGWGMVPVFVRIGDARFQTSLWPKNGTYIVPIKDAIRSAEHLAVGDMVTVVLAIRA